MPGTNPNPCSHSAMALRVGNEIVMINTATGRDAVLGAGNMGNFNNQTTTWQSGNWTLQGPAVDTAGPLPVRVDHGMDYDGTNVVLFGGRGGSETVGVLNDTWTWNGTTWSKKTPGTSPFGRFKHEISKLNGVGALMFGGTNGLNFLQETWLWNGSNWSQLSPANSPSARIDFAMAGSSATTNILLFGGKGVNSCLNDTWMWVGTNTGNWVQQTPAVSPPVMAESALAFDAANNQYIMFGGRNDNNILIPQTWIWTGGNGGNWRLVTPATQPTARIGAQMAYDGAHVILFGGSGLTDPNNETWQWSGGLNGNWVRV